MTHAPSPWICVRTVPQREAFAERSLHQVGFETYCPRYERWISHARRRRLVLRPLFPNYLFARTIRASSALGAVRRAPGVAALAAHDLAAAVVPDFVIAALRAREDPAGRIELANDRFIAGEAVRVVSGPLADVEAIFSAWEDSSRSRILLSLLGKQHSLAVPSHLLDKVA